jgi:hypothetical protein
MPQNNTVLSNNFAMKKVYSWSLFSIVLCILLVGSMYYYRHPVGAMNLYIVKADGSMDVAKTRKALAISLMQRGSEKTYEAFKQTYGKSSSDISHAAAHLFGEALYTHDGITGIRICDANFSFGCFHSFFGKAVRDNGISIVKELDAACVSEYGPQGLGCVHGIGHGIGEYMGGKDIEKQLEICGELTWQGRFFGCKEGVFMEYNMPTEAGSDDVRTSVRSYDTNNPYGPCLAVDKRFQPACFLEITNWWETVLQNDFEKISALCSDLHDIDNKEACYLGIGYSIGPKEGYDSDKTRAVCRSLGDTQSELLCRAGASWSFFANPRYRDSAPSLCKYDDSNLTLLCEQRSDLLSY